MAFIVFIFFYGISVCGHRFAIVERLHWNFLNDLETLSLGEVNISCFFKPPQGILR